MAEAPDLAFKSPEQLRQLLRLLGGRLHYINRVSGESHYMWHLANLISAAGELAELIEDREVSRAFGDGYTKGTLSREEQLDRILAELRQRLRP